MRWLARLGLTYCFAALSLGPGYLVLACIGWLGIRWRETRAQRIGRRAVREALLG